VTYDQALRRANVAAWILAIVCVCAWLASSCHHVEDGRSALCLGVTATRGLCVEWVVRP